MMDAASIKKQCENFGKNTGDIMHYLGWSQNDLAIRSGLTPAAISQIIAGNREPTLKTVLKIIEALGVTFERLCDEP